jgi:WD40 repeat protein
VAAGVDAAWVWNAAAGQTNAKLDGHSGQVFSAAFSPDGQRIVTAGGDGVALICKIVTLDDIAHLLASK